jgi:predicted metal-dependent hydrolase
MTPTGTSFTLQKEIMTMADRYSLEYRSGTRQIEVITRDGETIVRAPRGTPEERIRAAVREHGERIVAGLNPENPPAALIGAGGRLIPYAVEFCPRCRTVTVAVRDGALVVRAPQGTSRHEIDAALRAREARILRALEPRRGEEHATLLAGRTAIPYVIAYRPRAVNLTLRVLPDHSVRVTAPPGISTDRVRSFVESHAAYIHRQIAARTPAQPVEYRDGGSILLAGREVTIRTEERSRPSLEGALLLVPDGRPVERSVSAYLRAATLAGVNRTLPWYAGAFGVPVPPVQVRFMKTFWGRCHPDPKIVFNERCAMLPSDLLDYIVAHEVCHILHPHHQPTFYDALRAVMGDADARKERLKNYHPCWARGGPA